MGTDKALMRFQGVPLIQRAVEKLRRICSEVAILGDRPELARFGEVLPDRVPGRGPLGGIETALYHASNEWILLLPVDVPLVPGSMLQAWVWRTLRDEGARPAACCFCVDGQVQPLVSLLHQELAPYVTAALDEGERKVLSGLEAAALRVGGDPKGTRRGGLRVESLEDESWKSLWRPTKLQVATKHLWFSNVNTPEEFNSVETQVIEAKRH